MEIEIFKYNGLCPGCLNSLSILKKYKEVKNKYILGEIIHNEYISNNLKNKGFKNIDESETFNINAEDIIFSTAHGIDYNLKNKLSNQLVDATCSHIKRIYDFIENNENIIFIGDQNHIECKLIFKNFPKIYFYDVSDGFITKKPNKNIEYHLINQSTLIKSEYERILNLLKSEFKLIPLFTTCEPLKKRYKEIEKLFKNSKNTLFIVIGGKNSNNTKNILKIYYNCANTKNFIKFFSDFKINEFNKNDFNKIILLGGTSTSIEQIISYKDELLKTLNN